MDEQFVKKLRNGYRSLIRFRATYDIEQNLDFVNAMNNALITMQEQIKHETGDFYYPSSLEYETDRIRLEEVKKTHPHKSQWMK